MGAIDSKIKSVIDSYLPDVIRNLSNQAVKLLQNPIRFVMAVIIAVLLEMSNWAAELLNSVVLFFQTPPALVGNVFRTLSGSFASIVFGLISAFNEIVVTVVEASGPAAPIVLVAIYGGVMWVLYLGIVAVSQLPVLKEISNIVRGVIPW